MERKEFKVLLINGSPRPNGNTSVALAEVARQLEKNGIGSETVWIGNKPIRGSIACIGNVGPGFGDIGSMCNYADLPAVLKCTGLAEMLIGRLEIFPLMYLFQSVRFITDRISRR